jgi:hypothetical protein
MTRFDPTLIVTRLVVERNGAAVYDEKFHVGVNVIRGENSSGKSTILNFIFYGLGGDLAEWSEVALLCSRVFIEVNLSGKSATLSRQISEKLGQSMDVFGGEYELSKEAPVSEWIRFPYRRSENKESFSQALFRLLHIPEVTNDVSGNVTFHQVLRLLYSDQLSPVDDLFRFERFDPPVLRDAIGRLLCGAYDSTIYDNEIQIRNLSREFDEVSAQLRSLVAVLGQAEQGLTLEWIGAQHSALQAERTKIESQIEAAEKQAFVGAARDQLTLKAQADVYEQVQKLQIILGAAQQRRDALELSISDSAKFITSLEAKIGALDDSSAVATYFGDIKFSVCPACYAPIEAEDEKSHACHLCKTPFDSEIMRSRIVAMINEAAIQLKQSRILQDDREKQRQKIESEIERLNNEWRTASQRLASLERLPSSEAADQLRTLHRNSGYVDRQIEDLAEKSKLVVLIDQLTTRKNQLNDSISRLKTQNDTLRGSQQNRLSHAYTEIADQIRMLLRNDLRRQDSFENPESIEFDFGANRISVDGHRYFSASSRVILKSSFCLGFLAAATRDRQFRHPRFCIIDTIEDKGMEPERSHNFQNQILQISNETKVEHQIIYATAMISADLDDEEHTIGKFSTRDDPSIKIQI